MPRLPNGPAAAAKPRGEGPDFAAEMAAAARAVAEARLRLTGILHERERAADRLPDDFVEAVGRAADAAIRAAVDALPTGLRAWAGEQLGADRERLRAAAAAAVRRRRDAAIREDLEAAIEAGAAAVAADASAYGPALETVTAILRADRSLSAADREAMALAVVDRFAGEMIGAEIAAGRGEQVRRSVADGHFDAYLLPETRDGLLQAASEAETAAARETAEAAIEADPARFLDLLGAGAFEGLPAEEQDRLARRAMARAGRIAYAAVEAAVAAGAPAPLPQGQTAAVEAAAAAIGEDAEVVGLLARIGRFGWPADELAAAVARDRERLAAATGHAPADWTLYLAQDLGAAAAAALLTALPESRAVEAVGPEAVADAFAGHPAMTAEEFAGLWRARFARVRADAPDPVAEEAAAARLSDADIAALRDAQAERARRAEAEGWSEAAALRRVRYREDDPADRARRHLHWERTAAIELGAADVEALAADAFYEAALPLAARFARDFGSAPRQAVRRLLRDLGAEDPELALRAADAMAALRAVDPLVWEQADAQSAAFALTAESLHGRGLEPGAAVEAARRRVWQEQAGRAGGEASAFKRYAPTPPPLVGLGPDAEGREAFVAAFAEAFDAAWALAGDAAAAAAVAEERVTRLWSATQVGLPQAMRWAPEAFFGLLGAPADRSPDVRWLRRDLAAFVRRVGALAGSPGGAPDDDEALLARIRVAAHTPRGALWPVGYAVVLTDPTGTEAGTEAPLRAAGRDAPALWRPDYHATPEAAAERARRR